MTHWKDSNAPSEPSYRLAPKVSREQKIENVRADALKLARLFNLTFTSPQGAPVWAQLKARFSDRSSMVPGDPYATAANEGAREVCLYIQDMIDAGDKDDVPDFLA